MQRQGYPNITVLMFSSYNDFTSNKYTDVTPALMTLTIRDGLLSGVNEGMLQIYDDGKIHKKLTGNEFFQVFLTTANTSIPQKRIYAMSDFSVSIDKKNDNIITFQLCTWHQLRNYKFCKRLTNNATTNLTSMLSTLYNDAPLLKPAVSSVNVRLPATNWVTGFQSYKRFVRKHGLSIDNDSIPLLYEGFDGLVVTDHYKMKQADSRVYVLVDPTIVGEYGDIGTKIMFDFEWKVKQRKDQKIKTSDVTYYTQNFMIKDLKFSTVGQGTNSVLAQRSGVYSQKLDKKGLEERARVDIAVSYEGYSSAKVYGDFTLKPTDKIIILDPDQQISQTFFVDEVVHEISRTQSITNLYMINGDS